VLDPKKCPLMGPIDVALVVRRHAYPRPTPLEHDGVSCAIRAGVPIVTDGPAVLDPFEPWEVGRAEYGDVELACQAGAARGRASLVDTIRGRIDRLLNDAGVDPGAVTCRVDHDGPRMRVQLAGPIPDGIRNALAVRTLDALRTVGRTFGQVDVTIEPAVRQPAL
jgi:hypothetical protein